MMRVRSLMLTVAAAVTLAAFAVPAPGHAQQPDSALAARLRGLAEAYLSARAKPEHLSAVSVNIDRPGQPAIAFAVGAVSREPGAAAVTPSTLFEIGSITKSFTAATLLQLQAEGKLSLDQTLGEWLPQYPAWSGVTIRRLLHMVSGIPGYDDQAPMLASMAKSPAGRRFSDAVLVGFVDPSYPRAPAPTKGWDYSNTNYILSGMIIEKATGRSYAEEIRSRFIDKLGLSDTFYSPDVYPPSVRSRMPAGYFWAKEALNRPLEALYGKDVSGQDLSWAASAGGIVSTPSDVTRWVRALYTSDLLTKDAQDQLRSVVSMTTGKPIAGTSAKDPRGFGLGVGQLTDPRIGTVWFYQGETMGFRVMYVYVPADDTVITVGVNSATNDKADHLNTLIIDLHDALGK